MVENIKDSSLFYLDKIAVADKYQNNGIGKKLWQLALIDYSRICWRAKINNTINSFYKKKCDALLEFDPWIVYSKHLDKTEIEFAIDYALNKPETLK